MPGLRRFDRAERGYSGRMSLLLLILGIILIVAGVFALLRRQLLWGVVLLVIGVIIAPGGYLL